MWEDENNEKKQQKTSKKGETFNETWNNFIRSATSFRKTPRHIKQKWSRKNQTIDKNNDYTF